MALEIVWTQKAISTFDEIVAYIQRKFGDSSVRKFLETFNEWCEGVAKFPKMYANSPTSEVRRGLFSKQTTVYYHVIDGKVELLLFWNNRKKPRMRPWEIS